MQRNQENKKILYRKSVSAVSIIFLFIAKITNSQNHHGSSFNCSNLNTFNIYERYMVIYNDGADTIPSLILKSVYIQFQV